MKNAQKVTVKQTTMDSKLTAPEGLREFFIDDLKDIYWAEKALTKALPKMIKNATDSALVDCLTSHLAETQGHVSRIEEVFNSIDVKAVAKKCEAMTGLIKEAEQIMTETVKGPMRDAGIIAAGQKVEHYEIASYGTLAAYAEMEEKAADEKLTEVTAGALMMA
jgi:ferritin-like metal-binding protein YciE